MLQKFMNLHARRVGAVVLGVVALAACGGDDEADATTIPTTPITVGTTSSTTTTTPANAPVQYVTEGATVVVANASRVDGAASRMTKQLKEVGYTTGAPTGAGATLQRIDTTQIFYVAGDAAAQAVAESIKGALGGGAITVAEMPTPAPTETGELGAGETVVVAIGNDVADKTLDQLQGKTSATGSDSGSDDSGSGDTGSGDTGSGSGSTDSTAAPGGSTTTSTTTAPA